MSLVFLPINIWSREGWGGQAEMFHSTAAPAWTLAAGSGALPSELLP